MKKLIYIIFILMFSLIFISCEEEKPPVIEDVYYNVTFKVDQEETVITVKENTHITKPADPIKENSEFKGWYLDNELYDFNTLVTKDITLVALFDEYFKVTFKVDTEETTVIVKENTKVTKPSDPVIEDHEFIGWYLDDELYDFNTVVTKDITLVALFDEYFKVTFKVDREKTVITVKENTPITKPADPVKEACEFKGWYLDNELYDFNTLVTKDITLVALFDKIKPIIEISVESNKLNMGYSTQIQSIFHNTEELKLSYEVDKEGIVYINSKGLVTALKPGVVRIKATWTDSYNKTTYSNKIEIEVLDEILNEDKIDLKGYTITHNDSIFLNREALEQSDGIGNKSVYQLLLYIEEKYNCRIEYVDQSREKDRIIDLDFHGNLNSYGHAKDLTDLVNKYESKFPTIFDENQYAYMINGDKIYNLCAYRGISYSQGFYYNSEFIKGLGLKDPLDLYLEGKWTYSNFISWCQKAKEILDGNSITDKFGDKISVIYNSGNAMYYGMMTTIGKRIIDPIEQKDNINCEESQEIKKVINYLEYQEITDDRLCECLLIASNISFPLNFRVGGDYDYGACQIDNPSLVPYPYPDDFDPNNVYFREEMHRDLAFNPSQDINYPDGVEFEDIFLVIMELFTLYGYIADIYSGTILDYSFIYDMDERVMELLNNVPDERFLYQYADYDIDIRNYIDNYLHN